MPTRLNVLPGARALFPSSANARVNIRSAWHPDRSSLTHPEPDGVDGWESQQMLATTPRSKTYGAKASHG